MPNLNENCLQLQLLGHLQVILVKFIGFIVKIKVLSDNAHIYFHSDCSGIIMDGKMLQCW